MSNAFAVSRRIVTACFAAGSALSMAGVYLFVFVNAVRRYTFGKSFEWGEELPIYLAAYGVMFGAAYAYLDDRHVRFTPLVSLLPASAARCLLLLVDLLVTLVGAALAYSGFLFAQRRGEVEASGIIGAANALAKQTGIDSLAALGLMAPYQAAMALGGGMLACAALLKLVERVRGERRALAGCD